MGLRGFIGKSLGFIFICRRCHLESLFANDSAISKA